MLARQALYCLSHSASQLTSDARVGVDGLGTASADWEQYNNEIWTVSGPYVWPGFTGGDSEMS
jgi:hypothetical protein